MKKKILREYDFKKSVKLSTTENATVFKLNNGSVLKIYNPDIIELHKNIGVDIESKILDAKPLKKIPEILVPTSAVYTENGKFCGYTMLQARGIDYNKYDDNLTIDQRRNLKKYADVHHKLESVLKRDINIVFPDFCTCDNIFIDNKGNIQLIDYDGLQVGKHNSLSLSTSVGTIEEIMASSKYFTQDKYFTKELDKKSSIILYFLSAFNVDLNKVGQINPYTGKPLTLEEIFDCINLDDSDLCHKVWRIFQDEEPNEYLGDDVFRIAEKYDMEVFTHYNNIYIKKLKKKK